MMTDPIADMLTRIRNAQMARKTKVEMPLSKLKLKLAEILQKEGYIKGVEQKEDKTGALVLELKYEGREPAINEIVRVSKPGHRIYKKANELPKVLNGFGIAIVSTPKGLMTNKDAVKLGLGGEVICSVY